MQILDLVFPLQYTRDMTGHHLEVIILVGLQGAGKSSFYRSFFSDYICISKDLMKNKKHKEVVQARRLLHALTENQSVVIDNMNLTKVNRQSLISLAHQFNAKAKVYYFPISVKEVFERNAGPNRREVPPVAIYTALKQFEEPDWNEGFDKLFIVQLKSPSSYDVKEVKKGMNLESFKNANF